MSGWLILMMAILLNVLGNFFIKRLGIHTKIDDVFGCLRPSFIAGVALFGIWLLLYARALKDMPITLAYPIMVGVTLTFLSMLAIFSLGKRFAARDALGAAFIVAGIALLSHAV